MKSWIHEISENYVSVNMATKDKKIGLLQENILNYLDEQLQNAFEFGISDLNKEQISNLLEYVGDIAALFAKEGRGGRISQDRRARRIDAVRSLLKQREPFRGEPQSSRDKRSRERLVYSELSNHLMEPYSRGSLDGMSDIIRKMYQKRDRIRSLNYSVRMDRAEADRAKRIQNKKPVTQPPTLSDNQ